MSEIVQNGRLCIEPLKTEKDNDNFIKVYREKPKNLEEYTDVKISFPISFIDQFQILLKRRMKQQVRNRVKRKLIRSHVRIG